MISDDLKSLRRGLSKAAADGSLTYGDFVEALGTLDAITERVRELEAQAVPVTARASQADGNNVIDFQGHRAARDRRQAGHSGGGHAA